MTLALVIMSVLTLASLTGFIASLKQNSNDAMEIRQLKYFINSRKPIIIRTQYTPTKSDQLKDMSEDQSIKMALARNLGPKVLRYAHLRRFTKENGKEAVEATVAILKIEDE